MFGRKALGAKACIELIIFKKYPADSLKEKEKSINLEEVLIGIARMAQRLAYGQAGL